MCAISLQYDHNNAAAVKMLESMLASGLFSVCSSPASKTLSAEELNREMAQSEKDAQSGRLVDADTMRATMQSFVQERAGI